MEFVKYRTFHDETLASELISVLKDNNIEYNVKELSSSLDASFRGSDPQEKEIIVKVLQKDFEKINKIWEEDLQVDMKVLDGDHYLLQFTDEELFNILVRPDEWSPQDVKLSTALLKKRGKQIDEDLVSSLKKQRIRDLSKPESSQVPWIIFGYFISIFGGIIGIAIGWHLLSSKKTLPNGDKIYSFRDSDRQNGKIILYLGIFFLLFWVSARFIAEII